MAAHGPPLPAAHAAGRGGTFGRALVVDLTRAVASELQIPQEEERRWIGGAGLGLKLLAAVSDPRGDPLGEAAALVFAFSPLVGTPLTTSAKMALVARSPQTERLCDALSSSHFAIAGKRNGIDALVITGRAAAPVVVVIDDGSLSLEPAAELLGLSAAETTARITARLGAGFRVAAIGPAGERGVLYATVSNDGRHAGRGGLGSVLGAKGVKAVAIRGTRQVPLAHPGKVVAIARRLAERSQGRGTEKYRELGTVANLLVFNRLGVLPTANFGAGIFAQAAELSGERLKVERELVRESCAACTIGCGHIYAHGAGGSARTRIEYESLFALGSLVGVADLDQVLAAAALCDELGIDTISAGGTIAFAMEAAAEGVLPRAAGDPLPRFGDGAAVLELVRAIGERRPGLGELLGQGSRRAAAIIGQGSERYACHVKGLEMPGYDPRGLQTLALGLAVNARGADHNRSGAYEADLGGAIDRFGAEPRAHADQVIAAEERAALLDSLILCKFVRGALDDLHEESAEMLAAVTGWDIDAGEVRDTARRIVVAKRLYNQAAGWTRAEDTLPAKILARRSEERVDAGMTLDRDRLEAMVAAYYEARGFDASGCVPPEMVRALGLEGLFEALPEGVSR